MFSKIIITTVIASLIEAFYDSEQIKRGINPEHLFSAIIRSLGLFVLVSVFTYEDEGVIIYTVCCLILYSMVFDLAINYFRGLPLYLLGKTAFTDRLARKIGADLYGWTALKGVLIASLLLFDRYF